MHGTQTIPFNTLFADTVDTHGSAWARQYYLKHGMQAWEFRMWLKALRTR
jgi:hypothetical protein